ncbi:MAG: hypothetical protein JNJ54_32430 [Myxococcaceae bacterium]|nr:hypothetical protein [Myxococcaceae bacterium]
MIWRVVPGVLLLAGCAGRERLCDPVIEAPARATTSIGSSLDVLVRFVNGSAKAVHVSQLELSTDEELSFASGDRELSVPSGTCESPGERLVTLRFTPTRVGARTERLTALLDDTPGAVSIQLIAVGPQLDATKVVNFGPVGLLPAGSRTLEVRNVGTVDTSLEVRVEQVRAASASTRSDELCVGVLQGGRCEGAGPVPLRRAATMPLRLVPASAGQKAWDVELSAGAQRAVVRVLATVVDTSGCVMRAPPPVDFGLPVPPERARRQVHLENTGSTSCLVDDARTTDPQFVVTRAPSNVVIVQPGEVLSLDVELALNSVRSTTATLRVDLARHDSRAPASVDVTLEAKGASAACLRGAPEQLDFGTWRIDCRSSERRFDLFNVCERPVIFSSMTVEAPFELTSVPAPGTAILPARSVVAAARVTSLSGVGSVSGAVRIEVDDGSMSAVGLTVRGEPPSFQSDTFRFEHRPQVDVVLVLDDSPSFAMHHGRVRAELDRLAEHLGRETNARIAVTTTDVTATGPQGRFRSLDGGVRWASPATAAGRADFAALSALTTSGAEHQSCLEAAARSVTAPLSSDPTANGGFRRPPAPLSLICVTDDAEYTATPVTWRAALAGLDGGLVTYSVVGPFSANCPVDAPDLDGRHASTARALSGATADICGPWDSFYGVGLGSFGYRKMFFLSSTPQVQHPTFVVTIDGVVVPATSSSGVQNWRYDAATNAIIISDAIVEAEPDVLIVTYQTAC